MVAHCSVGLAYAKDTVEEKIFETIELSPDTVERVFQEVITGSITSHKDVLAVAIAQSCSGPQTRSTTKDNGPLQISQVLGVHRDADGSTEADIAVTALLVCDEEGVSRSRKDEYYHMEDMDGLAGYQIYATHTMYLKGEADPTALNPQRELQVVRMSTEIASMPTETVTKLVHRYGESLDPVEYEVHYEEETINYPLPFATYSYEPYGSSIASIPNVLNSYFQTSVEIFVGSSSFSIINTLPLSTPSLPGNLIYGW